MTQTSRLWSGAVKKDRVLIGFLFLCSLLIAVSLTWGVCPSCEDPSLLNVPGVRYLPLAGVMFSLLLTVAFIVATRRESATVGRSAEVIWSTVWPLLSLVLFAGAIGLATFATAAIKPCSACTAYWACLALSALVAFFKRMPGSWILAVAIGCALIGSTVIIGTSFRDTARGVIAQFMQVIGLPVGTQWPAKARVDGTRFYLVLGDCAPCVANSGRVAANLLGELHPSSTTLLLLKGTLAPKTEQTRRIRAIDANVFRLLLLKTNSSPHVFEVRNGRVAKSVAASSFVKFLRSR